jgi:hypothetical protein
MDIPVYQYILSMGGYLIFLLGLIAAMRKYPKFAQYFWMASLLTFPLWLMGGIEGWFRWAKIFSVVLPTILLGFARIANISDQTSKVMSAFKKNWILYFFYGVLFLNILEATLKDLALGNYTNAISGLILCITIPIPLKYWSISKKDNCDIVAYTTIGWNLLYTTWNACFVFGESPNYFASSVCILLAAEIYPIIKKRPELYVTARIYSLAAHLIIRASFPALFLNLMNSTPWYSDSRLAVWGLINLTVSVPYLGWYVYKMKKGTYDGYVRGATV